MALPLVLSLVAMFPGVQSRIVAGVTERLSRELNTEVSVGRVHAMPLRGIRIDDLLIRDHQQDTLLFAPRVRSGVDFFSPFKKHIYLGEIYLEKPVIHLSQTEKEEMNFTSVLDSIMALKPDTVKWDFSLRGVNFNDGNLRVSHPMLENSMFRSDTLRFSHLDLDLVRTSSVGDSLNFRLNHLALSDQSGLTIESGVASGKIRPNKISITDLALKTGSSRINIDTAEFSAGEDSEAVDSRFRAKMERLLVSFEELGLLLKDVPDIDEPFILSGEVYGSMNNLKGRDVIASAGEDSRMEVSFDLTDLTDLQETFIFMDVKELQTTAPDMDKFISGLTGKTTSLSSGLKKLGIIEYSGNLTGFLNDLVAYGRFETGLGRVNTDLSMRLDPGNVFSFSGMLNTEGFSAGALLGVEENMGGVTMNMEVNGERKSSTDYSAYLDGRIDSLEWNNYTYRDAEINGLFKHQHFDGSVSLSDPNGDFRFDGEIDGSGKLPRFRFQAHLENVMPDRLNILPQFKNGVATLSMETDFIGDNLDNLAGEISVYEGLLYTPETSVEIDTMKLKAFEEEGVRRITLSSDFVEGELAGEYNFGRFRHSFMDMVSHFLPSVAGREPREDLPLNRFDFGFTFKGFDRIAGLIIPGLQMASDGRLEGNVDSEDHILNIEAAFDYINYQETKAEDVEFHANTRKGDDLEVVTRAGRINRDHLVSFYNFSVHHNAGRDTLDMEVFWNNWDEVTNSGAIYTSTAFRRDKDDEFFFDTDVEPSTIILEDSTWTISEAEAMFSPKAFSIKDLEVAHNDQKLALNGFLHRESMDGMRLDMDNIDLSQFFGKQSDANHHFGGIADGSIELKDFYRDPLWSANFSVDDFCFDEDTLGFFTLGSQWDKEQDALEVNTSVRKGDKTPLQGTGYLRPGENSINMDLDLDGFSISFLETFIGNVLQDLDANASGNLSLAGKLDKPFLIGEVNIDRGKFDVDLLRTSYEVRDSVLFFPNEIRFKDLTVTDRHGEEGEFSGSIYHQGFRGMIYNLALDVNNMLVLDTRAEDSPYYYGTVYGRGNMHVSGNSDNLELDITGETLGNTRFFIPMGDTEEAVQSNFIRFLSDRNNSVSDVPVEEEDREYQVDMSGTELNMEIDVTPQARIQIIFDSTIGDLLSAVGEGNIQIQIDRQGNVNFFGDYVIDEGEYLFSLQNLVNKKFAINQGGTVTWQGNPDDARIDLTAVYKLKASLSDLVGPMADASTSSDENDTQRRIPIHCNLMLEGPLEEPGVKFGIEAPTLSESRESYMLDFISSEDEMNRQVLSLLVLNRFYTPDYRRMESDPGMQTNNAALVTTTEMLSNQLSRWLSTISSDVDVGVSYRPEDNISSEEVEVALSTQMFNNRVTINGNVGYGKYQTNTSKMVGDFDMDVMLNRSGTIRAKAYTHSNDDVIYETSPTTQGIGVTFKEEFNNFKDVLRKYWNVITGKSSEESSPNN
ncbi:MAG: translocation/assembly module TamB domain-containing protein [Marinilabilia sp.]